MSFATLLYHEIREASMLHAGQASPIDVRQAYEDQLPAMLFVTLAQFETQMAWLAAQQYHTLTLDEVCGYCCGAVSLPEKSVLLTFDDCWQSMGKYAYPILKKYRFHATAFVVTEWLNTHETPFTPERSVCMTAEVLARMTDVFEYANHSAFFHTRTDVKTSKMMTAGDGAFLADLQQCNAHPLLQAKDVFAYPFGLYEQRNVDLLQQNGFRLAFTCNPGKNTREDNPLLLKRNVIPPVMELDAFAQVVG